MVDVIIPTYNNYDELSKCLHALCNQTVRYFQVWIAVDGSRDNTTTDLPNLVKNLPFRAHILEHEDKKNHGRSATRNLALTHIEGEYVWFLDSDMHPTPYCLQAHLNLLETLGKNAISVGAIQYTNVCQNIWARYVSTRGHAKYTHGAFIPWNYFITANSLLPSCFFTSVNGFDEKISKYGGEDMELSYRIHKKFNPLFCKNDLAVCHTQQDKTLSKALEELTEYGTYGLPYIFNKHPDMPKVYYMDKITGKASTKMLYYFLTHPIWTFFIKKVVRFLPFRISKFLINYLVISAIFKGYKNRNRK
ncbi:MAG: glycosyltransferase [Bacteroidia bacterium]|nr:glycosyltransferase [Bacteroidia bacterium]MDW8345878.1 glycosyltransferase [Bacteroidia bacterium]